jgi:hypothetical protein
MHIKRIKQNETCRNYGGIYIGYRHQKIVMRKENDIMPEIKMKIGERKQEAEIKLLETLESHGWGTFDVLEVIDADRRTDDTYEFTYINADNKREKVNLSDIEELLDKMEKESGFLSVTDKKTNETHMIAVKQVNDVYVIADAPTGANVQDKIREAVLMEGETNAEVGFFEGIIEALKEFLDNVINGLEVLRNRMPEDAYTRYKEPGASFKEGLGAMNKDEIEFTAKFNAAMFKVFKDNNTILGNPFGGGMSLVGTGNTTTFNMVADFIFKHAETDIFKLDLNSPEALAITESINQAYLKANTKGLKCVEKYKQDYDFAETLIAIRDMHEVKAEAEAARGRLANMTGKEYANMDTQQKEEFKQDIVAIVKAELTTEFLKVLPAAGTNLHERFTKMEGMKATLKSLDNNQALETAILDSTKPTLKETLKSLSEKIKNKEFLKVIQNDMKMQSDAYKKAENKVEKEKEKEIVNTNSKANSMK